MRRMLLAAALLLAGCSESGPKKTVIAVIPKGTTHVFWKSVHAGAKKAAAELGVEILWKGPLLENDRQGQINEVETFVNRKVSGIVLAPLDRVALQRPVAEAKAQGMPVVIFDSGIQGEDYVSYVATDNLKGGRLAGEYLAKILGGKGKVAVLRYMEGSASTTERETGFLEAAKAGGLEIVSDNQYAGATADTALKASENFLSTGKAPDGIFCPNESSVVGMLKALKAAGLAGKVKLVGFDSSESLVAALQAGELHATVVQNPVKMGYLAVKAMVDHLAGRPVERRVDTGAALVSKETMERPEEKALLHPERAE